MLCSALTGVRCRHSLVHVQLSPDGGLGFALPVDVAQAKARVNVPDLFAALDMAPTEALACLAAAAHAVALLSGEGRARLAHLQPVFADSRVRVHLYNHSDTLHPFRGIRSSLLGARGESQCVCAHRPSSPAVFVL